MHSTLPNIGKFVTARIQQPMYTFTILLGLVRPIVSLQLYMTHRNVRKCLNVIVESERKGINALYIPIHWEGKNSLNLIRDEVRMMPTLVNKSDLPMGSSKIHCIEYISAASGKTPLT